MSSLFLEKFKWGWHLIFRNKIIDGHVLSIFSFSSKGDGGGRKEFSKFLEKKIYK